MSALFACSCHQGHVRFAQTRVPVVLGDSDTIGSPPSSAQFMGKLSASVGEGSGSQSIYGASGATAFWSWSRPTEALDRTAAQMTSNIAPAAIRRLRIKADTRLAAIGPVIAGSVTMDVSGDVVRVIAPPPLPAASWPQAPSPTAPVSAADSGYIGTWEGPWEDSDRGQRGRLYIDVRGDGVVTGWMKNAVSNNTVAVAGAFRPGGIVDLICRCQPSPPFAIQGALSTDPTGDIRGELTLSTAAGVFGTPKVTLKRMVR